MKIAISTSVIQRGKTGVAQYVFALVRALRRYSEEHDFYLLALEEDRHLFDFATDKMTVVPVGERWRPAVKNVLWHQAVLPDCLRQHGIDVLHVPSYRRMVARVPCAKVATIHDLAPFHVRGKYDAARMLYGRVVARALARAQDQIIAVSGNTAKDIERFFGVPADRQRVIWNGLDHHRFHLGNGPADRCQAVQRWGLSAPFFLYVSRLEHPGKNHVRLIEAFTRFKAATGSSWQLVLGGSDWHGAEVIRAAAAASRFAADIRFLGFVDDADLPALYRAAGAMVYPSLFEGFGMPPLEAMACGCPVISSGAGSLAEVVGDAARLIAPTSIPDIEQALALVSTNESLRSELIAAGLRRARLFDWDRAALEVFAVYQAAARRRHGVSRCDVSAMPVGLTL